MSTNITLTLDSQLVEQAELYAHAHGKSLTAMVEDYVRLLVLAQQPELPELPPNLARLRGAINLPEGSDYKQALADAIQERHGQ